MFEFHDIPDIVSVVCHGNSCIAIYPVVAIPSDPLARNLVDRNVFLLPVVHGSSFP